MIQIKRAYNPPAEEDGYRVLVDRLWSRGVSKEDAALDRWMKEVAQSSELRRWYDHHAERWKEFERRYRQELEGKRESLEFLAEKAREGTLTLVYAARDTERNNAAVPKEHLEQVEGDG